MPTCFVMQPFDGGDFDKRYAEVFVPAITAAGLEPYRVDQDPKVSIPIQDIENGIRQAQICLAEITLDNPNVWFELGFAIACRKEVVLVCSDARPTRFPFDVQHRTIIQYSTAAPSAFGELQRKITEKIKAYLDKAETLETVAEVSQLTAPTTEGFMDHEIVTMAAIAQNIQHHDDRAAVSQIQRDMEASGYTRVAASVAIKALVRKGFIESGTYRDFDGDERYSYGFTEKGWDWVLENQRRFTLRSARPGRGGSAVSTAPVRVEDFGDDIPF